MRNIFIFIGLLCGSMAACAYEQYNNDVCNFSCVLPDSCHLVALEETKDNCSYMIFNSEETKPVAFVFYYNVYQKGKAISYRAMKKLILASDSTLEIISEPPFYDLTRKEMQCTYKTAANDSVYTTFEQFLFKSSSYFIIKCPYPLSQDSKDFLDSFDNKPTFRGRLMCVRQNAGTIFMSAYLTLLCILGFCSGGTDWKKWIYIALSCLLWVICIICLWHDLGVLALVLGCSIGIWLLFYSRIPILMWIIESIFGI